MANIRDVDYGTFVRVKGSIYYVDDTDEDQQISMLVPANELRRSDSFESITEKAKNYPPDSIELLKPVKVSPDTVRSLFRLEVMPWELAMNGSYPFALGEELIELREEDLLCFIDNLQNSDNVILLNDWMEYFYYAEAPFVYVKEPDCPGFNLRYLWNSIRDTISWFDFVDECKDDFLNLKTCYLKSKGKPLSKMVLPEYSENSMLDELEQYAKEHPVTEEIRAYYESLLEAILKREDPDDIDRYAYAYYGGNGIVECNWNKSEQALLKRFSPDEEPPVGNHYCANSLGYIYYSDRLGKPDYDKAFRCFSYAAEAGVIEATYKLSDMYRKGHGTAQDPEKAWQLLSELYDGLDKKHPAKRKLPDVALRMGYCYRDGVGVERDYAKAKEFFLLAKKGIELRLKKHPGFGDEVVKRNIEIALEDIEHRLHLDKES